MVVGKWLLVGGSEEVLLLKCLGSLQGLFARRRQLLLTEGPHLYYVDPVNRVLKGEIPWSSELRPEAKNFKTFFVHTVTTIYFCSFWDPGPLLFQI